MIIKGLFILLAAVIVVHAVEWHEDPPGNLVKNVYFTDGLNNWVKNQNVGMEIIDQGGRPALAVAAMQTTSTPGVKQSVPVVGGNRYRLKLRGYRNHNSPVYPWVGTAQEQNIVWEKKKPLLLLESSDLVVDFDAPAGATSVVVGVLFDGTQAAGDRFVLEWVSVMPFSPNWLPEPVVPQNWRPLNAVTVRANGATGIIVVSAADSLPNGSQMNGVFAEGIVVQADTRYRLEVRGRRDTAGFVTPRITRTSDDSAVVAYRAVAATSLARGATDALLTYEFTVPEGVTRVNVGFVFAPSTTAGAFSKGQTFVISTAVLRELPNQIPDGALDTGRGQWTSNGDTTIAVVVDGADNALECTTHADSSTPGIRLDKVPVIPLQEYHFEVNARIESSGSAYPWIQEPSGEDLYWVYKNSAPRGNTASAVEGRSVDFVVPRGVNWINIGLLFSSVPTPFNVGDKIVLHSAMLTGGALSFGRPPRDPVRPIPPPPPPPKIINPPPAAPAEPPPSWFDALKVTPETAKLSESVEEAKPNIYNATEDCSRAEFKFMASYATTDYEKCAAECEVRFYNVGEPGTTEGYKNYRSCQECCTDRLMATDGLEATGTNGKTWRPVVASMIDSQSVKNADVLYRAEASGKLYISGQLTSSDCTAGGGQVVFIKGPWTKITYKETFTGFTGCPKVFSDDVSPILGPGISAGLLPFSEEGGDLIYDRTNMGGFSVGSIGQLSSCNPGVVSWWKENGNIPQSASVTLRRNPEASRAGLATATFCGKAGWEFSDIFVWM